MKNYKKILITLITAVFFFYLSVNSYAQFSSIKKLKNEVEQVNNIKKSIHPGDPWTLANIITPQNLNAELQKKSKHNFIIYNVGFEMLYNQGHIKNAILTGPAFRPEGLNNLKTTVKKVVRNKEIIIYCGCCGWTECPNIHPAFLALKKMGFKNIKVLYLPHNFTKDWIDKGYPVVR